MEDNKLAEDEARRSALHGAIKSNVEADVNKAIAARATQAEHAMPAEARTLNTVAVDLHARAVDEVVSTEREVGRARGLARVAQVIDFIFGIIYALLALRLLLSLLAARPGAGFVKFLYSVTDPFYAPFRGIVDSPATEGGHTLVVPLIIAMVVYGLFHIGIRALLRLIGQRRTHL